MAKRKAELGLGRGLNALLGDPELQSKAEGAMSLPISQVEPGLNQPRKRFDPVALADLTESVREYGVIQPLTVRRLASGYYQIIAGERRWRAAKAAGLSEVPVTVVEADDRKVLELGLIENLQRADLNPAEESRGYQALIEQYGLTQEQVAQRMGKSRSAIANALRLLALPPEVMSMLEEETLSSGHARTLLPLSDAQLQIQTAKKVVEGQLSVRQTEALVKALLKGEKKPDKPDGGKTDELQFYLGELEQDLTGKLGRKVRIQSKGKKGRVELEFYDTDDLESLLALLVTLSRREAPPDA